MIASCSNCSPVRQSMDKDQLRLINNLCKLFVVMGAVVYLAFVFTCIAATIKFFVRCLESTVLELRYCLRFPLSLLLFVFYSSLVKHSGDINVFTHL